MKKLIILTLVFYAATGLLAQNTPTPPSASNAAVTPEPSPIVNKKGERYLPEAGDWAISYDATPFLNYFGNVLSSHGDSAPVARFLNGYQTIMAKYYLDAHTALRALLRIQFNSQGQDQMVIQDTFPANSVPEPTVTDHITKSSHFIGLGLGIEKRRGRTRLQGYYGGELMFWFSGTGSTITYGNPYSTLQPSGSNINWYDFTGWSDSSKTPHFVTGYQTNPNAPYYGAGRPLEIDAGSVFGIGAYAILGFEYFFMPKISVGAEYTWGIAYTSTGQSTTTVEQLNSSATNVQTSTYHGGGSSDFGIDSGLNSAFGNAGGHLYITFHF